MPLEVWPACFFLKALMEISLARAQVPQKILEGAWRDMAIFSPDDFQPRAQAALSKSPFYELHELQVEDRDGVLLISGTVTSFYHKQLAQEVVRSVCQEIEVINSTCVVPEELSDSLGDEELFPQPRA
jgi:hypothetical protein